MLRALLLLTALLVAGCVQEAGRLAADDEGATLRVVDEAGEGVPYATVTLLSAGAPVAWLSTGPEGDVAIPIAFDRALVAATGFAPVEATVAGLVTLARAEAGPEAADPTPGLRMLPPYDFGAAYFGPRQACDARNTCGLSEPVVEVAGDGSIYASGTCCVGKAPPVWVSRDGGASWIELETPGVREATGIEGDFAIDEAGNVYFTDILLGAMWLTSWDKDGQWRHTVPVPLKPLVDRPWVRAGAANVVYFLYNTGASTNFHVSTDGGRTFDPRPLKEFGSALGNLGQGPERDHLWVVAGGKLHESTDGGRTWSEGEAIPKPDEDGAEPDGQGMGRRDVPVVDEAGRVLVTYSHGTKETGFAIYAAVREPDGTWREPVAVSPLGGTHFQPWPAAGRDGGFVVAWYGTDDEAAQPDDFADATRLFVHLAASRDGGATWQAARADPEPVLEGPVLRRLLDFLQVDVGPDGAAHVVYANNLDGSRAERTLYARTTIGLDLAPLAFPNGPHASPGASSGLPLFSQPRV